MVVAYLALGSNLGDRPRALQAAVDGLGATAGVEVLRVSRVYETDAVGPPQGDYLNAVVAVETDHPARKLLEVARSLEVAAGREPDPAKRERWGPRELDVDVLIVGDERVDEPDLVVPHPLIDERPFVLAPLADVAPNASIVHEGRTRFSVHTGGHEDGHEDRWPGIRPTDVELRVRKI